MTMLARHLSARLLCSVVLLAVIWVSITAAWDDYHEKYLDGEVLDDDEEKKIIAALIAISTGQEDVTKLPVSVEVGTRLLECYDDLGEE